MAAPERSHSPHHRPRKAAFWRRLRTLHQGTRSHKLPAPPRRPHSPDHPRFSRPEKPDWE